MKLIILPFLLLFAIPLIAQEKVLELSKNGTERVRIFNENKRVKVKTIEGEKYIGRFKIIDDETIGIEGNIIPLNSIYNIKSRSVLAGVTGTILIIGGIVTIGYGLVLTMAGAATLGMSINPLIGVWVYLGGIGLTSTGILLNKFAPNQKRSKWSYKIIEP